MDVVWSADEKRDIGTCGTPGNGALLSPYAEFIFPIAVIQIRRRWFAVTGPAAGRDSFPADPTPSRFASPSYYPTSWRRRCWARRSGDCGHKAGTRPTAPGP